MAATPAKFSRIAVFCGSSPGSKPEYTNAAQALAREMVKRQIKLAYGGGTVGLMGVIAHGVHAGFGRDDDAVLGVIPEALIPKEISGASIGHVKVVADMHTRKAVMAEASQAFVAMPGGFGTLEEVFEMITWQTLGYHDKPVGLLNVCGFYNGLLQFLDHATESGFIKPQYRDVVIAEEDPARLLDKMLAYQRPASVIEYRTKQAGGTQPELKM